MRGTSTLRARRDMRMQRHISCAYCCECLFITVSFLDSGERLRAPGRLIAAFCVRSHTLRLDPLCISWQYLWFSCRPLTIPYLAAAGAYVLRAALCNGVMIENPNILIVDDERSIAELVAETLEGAGMLTQVCVHASEALPMVREGSFDLIILDVMMPGLDVLSSARACVRNHLSPSSFLSAKDEEADKVLGLTCGGDDYITKPFLPRELVARVKSCLRRSSYAGDAALQRVLRCRGIVLDPATHVASLHGERLSLTPKEFDPLAVLLRASGRPVATQDLYEAVWEDLYMPASSNSVMVHIRHLRSKLAALDSEQVFIETVWGVGYKIAP